MKSMDRRGMSGNYGRIRDGGGLTVHVDAQNLGVVELARGEA